MTKYAALLGQCDFNDNNNKLRMQENAVLQTLTLVNPATGLAMVAGTTLTLFPRGDGSDDDLYRALKLTMDSHTGGTNVYGVAAQYKTDPSTFAGVVTISIASGGPNAFQILWHDALTTIDEGLFGFTNVNTANDALAKTSQLSPSCAWISSEVYSFFEPEDEYDVTVKRSRSGKVRTVRRGGPYDVRRFTQQMADSRRVLDWDNAADPTQTMMRFVQRTGTGQRFEFHGQTATAQVLGALDTTTTRIGTAWHLDEDSAKAFRPSRVEPGLALYNFDLSMLGYVP